MNKKEYMSELYKINSEMMKLKLKQKRIYNEYVSSSDIGKEFKIGDIVKITVDDRKPILGYVKNIQRKMLKTVFHCGVLSVFWQMRVNTVVKISIF